MLKRLALISGSAAGSISRCLSAQGLPRRVCVADDPVQIWRHTTWFG